MQFFSHEFVISAGAILFRKKPDSPLEICIIHYETKDEWLLPKGRKDEGEPIERTAMREVYEETGWETVPFAATMHTRATVPDVEGMKLKQPDEARLVTAVSTEPFAVTIRGEPAKRDMKLIYWFILMVAKPDAERVQGTQMEDEGFDHASFFEARTAIDKLTYEADRELARMAVRIYGQTMNAHAV